jgi:hypothetical protein
MVLMVVRQGAGPHEQWPKMLKGKIGEHFRQQRDMTFLKQAVTAQPKINNLLFFPGDDSEAGLLLMTMMR